MKNTLLLALVLCFGSAVSAQTTWVSSYIKSDGTYVGGHYRQQPNNTNHDNWTTSQNVNPWTQQNGYRAKDYSPAAYNYGAGKTIYVGPQGGQYYISDLGTRVYLPKRSVY